MAAKEKTELNMSEEEFQKRQKKAEEKQRDGLKDEFKKIFYRTTSGEFRMPFDVAWKNFETVTQGQKISISETERLTNFCIDIRKKYFESKNLGDLDMDINGNPNLRATLERKPDFFEEHPELKENSEIKTVLENVLTEQKFREIMEEKDLEIFWNKFTTLTEKETKDFQDKFVDKMRQELESKSQEILDIKKDLDDGKDVSEDRLNIVIEYEVGLEFCEKMEEEKDRKLSEEERYDILRNASIYLASDDIEKIKDGMTMLFASGLMTKEQISLFTTNRLEAIHSYLNVVNSYKDGAYSSFFELLQERREVAIENMEKRDMSEFKDTDIEAFIFKGIEENSHNSELQIEDIRNKLENEEQRKILESLRDIDFSQEENALLILKAYLDLDKKKSEITLNDEDKEKKFEDVRKVLKEVIFAKENAGFFGNYINRDKNNKKYLDEGKIEKNSESIEEYNSFFLEIENYVRYNRKEKGLDLEATLDTIRVQQLSGINKAELLKEYIEKREKINGITNKTEKTKERENLYKTERKLLLFEEYSTFLINGEIDLEKIKLYYSQTFESNLEPRKRTGFKDVILEFAKYDSDSGKPSERVTEEKKRTYFNEKLPGADFELYNEEYEKYKNEYCDKKAIGILYSAYINGRKIDSMSAAKQAKFMDALGYLYNSEDPQKREFANNIIKHNFSGIPLNEDGTVDKKIFDSLYKTYQIKAYRPEDVVNRFQKNTNLLSEGKLDFSREFLNVDLDGMNKFIKSQNDLKKGKDRLYTTEEQNVIDRMAKIDFTNDKNAMTVLHIIKDIKGRSKYLDDDDKVMLSALEKFVYSPQTRHLFSNYIQKNEIRFDETEKKFGNVDVIKALKYENKMKGYVDAANTVDQTTGERINKSEFFEDKNPVLNPENFAVLQCICLNDGDTEKLEEKLKSMKLFDNEVMKLLTTDGKIDSEKINKITSKLKDAELTFEKKTFLAKIMTGYFETESSSKSANENFDMFFENFIKTIDDLELSGEITNEDIKKSFDDRIENFSGEVLSGWDEYYSKRPEATPEDLERIAHRISKNQEFSFETSEDHKTSESKSEALGSTTLVSDEEFKNFAQNVTEKQEGEIYVSEDSAIKTNESKLNETVENETLDISDLKNIPGFEVARINADAATAQVEGMQNDIDDKNNQVDFAMDTETPKEELAAESINTDGIISESTKKSEKKSNYGIVEIIKNGVQNIFNKTKRLPDPNKDKEKKSILDAIKTAFYKKEKNDAEVSLLDTTAHSQSTFAQDGFYQNVDTTEAINSSKTGNSKQGATVLVTSTDERDEQ